MSGKYVGVGHVSSLTCTTVGCENRRYVSGGGIEYARCQPCRTKYSQDLAARHKKAQTQALTLAHSPQLTETPRQRIQQGGDEQRSPAKGRWAVWANLTIMVDKGADMVDEGSVNAFRVAADLPDGGTLEVGYRRTNKDG